MGGGSETETGGRVGDDDDGEDQDGEHQRDGTRQVFWRWRQTEMMWTYPEKMLRRSKRRPETGRMGVAREDMEVVGVIECFW